MKEPKPSAVMESGSEEYLVTLPQDLQDLAQESNLW